MNNIAITILVAVFFAWFALTAIWHAIDSFGRKKYKQYIDSIKIGDKFVMRESVNADVNPFVKIEPMIVEITDIRINKIGEKYVQYRYLDGQPNLTYNRKIDIFIELFVRCND